MTLAAFIPLLLSVPVWFGFWRINRKRGWFTIGEVIFWNVIILILIQLLLLRWF
ncbi:MAG: hypothetical protein LBE86_07130 [Gemmobacter sp.]|nr:hypothetical protein [Gemmobacter sp.]